MLGTIWPCSLKDSIESCSISLKSYFFLLLYTPSDRFMAALSLSACLGHLQLYRVVLMLALFSLFHLILRFSPLLLSISSLFFFRFSWKDSRLVGLQFIGFPASRYRRNRRTSSPSFRIKKKVTIPSATSKRRNRLFYQVNTFEKR